MRRMWLVVVFLPAFLAPPARAQEALTRDQRIADLNQLAAWYDKYYGPYEWKRDTLGFDLLRLTPWLQRIHHSDDLDFQEALIEYVASLDDAHSYVAFPTTFRAFLGMTVDIYDGKVLIDAIDRNALPAAQFPFLVGDELVSLDGTLVETLIRSFRKYAALANPRSTDRAAASLISFRNQRIMPHASELGETAAAVIRRATNGELRTFTLPWHKTGVPIVSQGPIPSPRRGNGRLWLPSPELEDALREADVVTSPSGSRFGNPFEVRGTLPAHMQPLRPLLNASVPKVGDAVLNFGGRFPIYRPPPGFVVRRGFGPTDFFLSGTYVSNGVRIGLIRFPTMAPPNDTVTLEQLDQEIAFFNANTDALVVDVMRNPGGILPFVEAVCQRLIPTPFRTIGFEVRANAAWLEVFAEAVIIAEQSNMPAEIIENLRNVYNQVLAAYHQPRGRSAPISLNETGSLTLQPSAGAYTKPLMVLTDEFSASAADMLPAIIQDNGRGLIFGMRTMGAGGSVVGLNATAYAESIAGLTVSIMNRGRTIHTPEYPPAPYIENIGVRPDIQVDFMTRANLVTVGVPFIEAFTQAVVKLAQSAAP